MGKRFLLYVSISIGVVMLLIFADRTAVRHKLRAYAQGATRNRMTEIASRAMTVAASKGEATTDLWEVLGLDEHGTMISCALSYGSASTGEIRDAWGNPIWLRPMKWEGEDEVFISFGPNGKDDGGQGDDIVFAAKFGAILGN